MPIIQGDYKFGFYTGLAATNSKSVTPPSYPYSTVLDVDNSQDFVYNVISVSYFAPGGWERLVAVNVADGTSSVHTNQDQYIIISYNEDNNTLTLDRLESPLSDGRTFNINYSVVTAGTPASAETIDKTRTTYSDLGDTVLVKGRNYLIKSMEDCYKDCVNLTTTPRIPSGVTDMSDCFNGCSSLITPPTIPSGVTDMTNCFIGCSALTTPPVMPDVVTRMQNCFYGCTSLTRAPVIPSSVTSMYGCFYNCTSLGGDIYIYPSTVVTNNCFTNTTQPITLYSMNGNVDTCTQLAKTNSLRNNIRVNIKAEVPKTFINTQMNYMTDEGLKPLSLQTDASLVQCRVPDLVNGGTIVTNVNDALIDLANRNKTPFVTYYFNDGDVINGIRFTWDYDNIIDSTLRLRGTSTGLDMVICKYTASFNGNYFIRAPRMGNDSSATYYRINNGTWRRLDVVTDIFSLASDDTVDVRLVVPSGNYISKQGQLAIFVSGGGA